MIPRLALFLALSPTWMFGPEHVGELLNEIHDEFPLVAIQSIESIRNHSQLVVRPFRSTLQ